MKRASARERGTEREGVTEVAIEGSSHQPLLGLGLGGKGERLEILSPRSWKRGL